MTGSPVIVLGIAGSVISLGMVISANIFYTKIGTYHPVNSLHDENKPNTEPGYLKILKLSIYNFIIAISVTGLIFIYTAFPIGGESLFGLTQGKALIMASIVMNFSIRVCSLSELTSNTIFDRSISFGYSFILSIYFLSFFAASVYLLENNFSVDRLVINSIPSGELSVILLLVIFGPIVSSVASELILAITGVDDDRKDEFSREDMSIL
ncbi:hypothetical protein [Halomicrobium katesii]|uniref:hypothetical protein n=1 Tax=Halomicrobium katesii TaxID=437163 RepID=UPI0012BA567D|nr:hypothetical protein [Halomicrobium katesii]